MLQSVRTHVSKLITANPATRAGCSPRSCTTCKTDPGEQTQPGRERARACSRSCAPRSGAPISRRARTRARRADRRRQRHQGPAARARLRELTHAAVGARLLVIGLDGATLDLVAPWAAAGELPVLGRLMARRRVGAAALDAAAGDVPGVDVARDRASIRAGTASSTSSSACRARCACASSTAASGARRRCGRGCRRRGRRVAVLTVPATYPPEPVNGVMVSGFDSPVTTRRRRVLRLPACVPRRDAPAGRPAAVRRLPGGSHRAALARRARWRACSTASSAARRSPRPCCARERVGRADGGLRRVRHGRAPLLALPRPGVAAPRAGAACRRHRCGSTARSTRRSGGWWPRRATPCVAVVSDHGSGGAGDRVVHLNRYLAQQGLLGFRPRGGAASRAVRGPRAARACRSGCRERSLRRAPAAAGRLEGGRASAASTGRARRPSRRSSTITRASGSTSPAASREGTVPPADYERTRDAVVDALAAWRDDDGRPVVERVWRREELYDGPATERAPDLLLELAAPAATARPACGAPARDRRSARLAAGASTAPARAAA